MNENLHKLFSASGEFIYPPVYTMERRSGFYYLGRPVGQVSSYPSSINYMYASPYFVGPAEKFDMIAVNCSAGSAGLSIRLGIYTNDNSFPDRLMFDSGDLPATGTGLIQAPINMVLEGMVWVTSVAHGGSTPQFAADGNRSSAECVGSISPGSYPPGIGYVSFGIGGALPGVWGIGNYTTASSDKIPYIWLRKAIY